MLFIDDGKNIDTLWGGSNYCPSGTLNLTGGGAGGTTAPTNDDNGQIIITYNVPP